MTDRLNDIGDLNQDGEDGEQRFARDADREFDVTLHAPFRRIHCWFLSVVTVFTGQGADGDSGGLRVGAVQVPLDGSGLFCAVAQADSSIFAS